MINLTHYLLAATVTVATGSPWPPQGILPQPQRFPTLTRPMPMPTPTPTAPVGKPKPKPVTPPPVCPPGGFAPGCLPPVYGPIR